MTPVVSLDTLGLYCPVPILKTARKIGEIGIGEVLEVISDDPVILVDMPNWCRSKGHDYLGSAEEAHQMRVYVRRRK